MRGTPLLLLALLIALFARVQARDLVFEQETLRLHGDTRTPSVTAVFRYQNHGSKPVQVLVEKPSCDCLVLPSTEFTAAPQSSGTYAIEFQIRGQAGLLQRTVRLDCSDAPNPLYLTIEVDVAQHLSVRPEFLFWQTGTPPSTRVALVRISPASFGAIAGVRDLGPAFTCEVAPAATPGVWEVRVRPVATSTRTSVKASIVIAVADGPEQRLPLYLAVK